MFRHACRTATEFLTPVVISTRLANGTVGCSVGAAVILNSDGWILTAAHMLAPARLHAQHADEIARRDVAVREILAGPGNESGRQKRIRTLGGADLIRNVSYWLGNDLWSVDEWHVLSDADIAIGQLTGFDRSRPGGYPTFQTGELGQGTSLCRLGFPFHSIDATFDEATGAFTLAPGSVPLPSFPNEGILTRIHRRGTTSDPAFEINFIETSSAGLRGQSGGPIFDVDGHVWGIQSETHHLSLGFNPEIGDGTRSVVEHQFMNLGLGAASDTVLAFLAHHGVAVATTDV